MFKKPNNCDETAAVETFQTQALEIKRPGDDFDPTLEPQTGDEYLTHMLYERQHCPAIVTCQPKKLNKKVNENLLAVIEKNKLDPIHKSDLFLTTIEWRVAQLSEFHQARNEVNAVRSELQVNNYNQSLELPLISDTNAWQKFCQEHSPVLSIILRFDQRTLELLLEMIDEWFACGIETESNTPEEELGATAAALPTSTVSSLIDIVGSYKWLGQWLYATLACLHLPIEPSVHGTLRSIGRQCVQQRSLWVQECVEKAQPFNVFIYLIAKVFDQLDFENYV